MRHVYEIHLSGSQMTDERFANLVDNVMLGGIKHRYQRKHIDYEIGAYSNAKEDMREFKAYCESLGYKVKCSNRNRIMRTQNDELVAKLQDYNLVTL